MEHFKNHKYVLSLKCWATIKIMVHDRKLLRQTTRRHIYQHELKLMRWKHTTDPRVSAEWKHSSDHHVLPHYEQEHWMKKDRQHQHRKNGSFLYACCQDYMNNVKLTVRTKKTTIFFKFAHFPTQLHYVGQKDNVAYIQFIGQFLHSGSSVLH